MLDYIFSFETIGICRLVLTLEELEERPALLQAQYNHPKVDGGTQSKCIGLNKGDLL